MLPVQALQALTRNVRINGGRGNVGMAQQHLYRTQVSPMIEQMRGKRMAQGVRRNWHKDLRL
jgi:hypothetical protein